MACELNALLDCIMRLHKPPQQIRTNLTTAEFFRPTFLAHVNVNLNTINRQFLKEFK